MKKILFLALACGLWAVQIHAAEVNSDAVCIQHSFKEVKVVTPFSLTHRPKSKRIVYDDIGCGLKWRKKQCSSIQMSFDTSAVVYDHTTLAEIVVSKAVFVQSPGITTPMGSGLVAFASPVDADAFLAAQAEGGQKLSYEDLLLLDLP